MKLLVTGANGFVGERLCIEARARGLVVIAVTRKVFDLPSIGASLRVESIDQNTNWRNALIGCDVVVHLAARVHVMHDKVVDPLTEFRKTNVAGTLNLAKQAAEAGVKRFVFVSSVKVNGETTQLEQKFTAHDSPAPQDAYGISKLEAEIGLRELANRTGIEVTIVRPPVVYGPGVKGNFYSLLGWMAKGLPLPLGGVTRNRRSLIALDNLVDLILICTNHSNAANQTFMASDGEDLSTAELLRRIGKAMNRPARLLTIPAAILTFAASLLRKRAEAKRLLDSLQVDITETHKILGWSPPISVDEGLRRAVRKQV